MKLASKDWLLISLCMIPLAVFLKPPMSWAALLMQLFCLVMMLRSAK